MNRTTTTQTSKVMNKQTNDWDGKQVENKQAEEQRHLHMTKNTSTPGSK